MNAEKKAAELLKQAALITEAREDVESKERSLRSLRESLVSREKLVAECRRLIERDTEELQAKQTRLNRLLAVFKEKMDA